jgi:hypothetical protein
MGLHPATWSQKGANNRHSRKKLLDIGKALGTLERNSSSSVPGDGSLGPGRPIRTAWRGCLFRASQPAAGLGSSPRLRDHSQAPKASLPLTSPGGIPGMPTDRPQPRALKQLREFRHGQRKCVSRRGTVVRGCVPRVAARASLGWGSSTGGGGSGAGPPRTRSQNAGPAASGSRASGSSAAGSPHPGPKMPSGPGAGGRRVQGEVAREPVAFRTGQKGDLPPQRPRSVAQAACTERC